MAKPSAKPRRTAKQHRSHVTIGVILEAAAQILERQGEEALTTNGIAERAGVSIGSVYQYFSNKQAILVAIAKRADEKLSGNVKEIAVKAKSPDDAARLAIRAYIALLSGHSVTRRAALKSVLSDETASEVGESVDVFCRQLPAPDGASRLDAFVLSRAVTGIVRAAVLEEFEGLHTAEFEDALMRLVTGYRQNVAVLGFS